MLADDFPADLDEVVDRLTNWSVWARERTGGSIIGSAEVKYRPERGDQETRRTPRLDIDALDAQVVGKAIAPAGGFPARWFLLIKLRFLIRSPKPVICRKMSIHTGSYEAELRTALFAVRNVLAKRK